MFLQETASPSGIYTQLSSPKEKLTGGLDSGLGLRWRYALPERHRGEREENPAPLLLSICVFIFNMSGGREGHTLIGSRIK